MQRSCIRSSTATVEMNGFGIFQPPLFVFTNSLAQQSNQRINIYQHDHHQSYFNSPQLQHFYALCGLLFDALRKPIILQLKNENFNDGGRNSTHAETLTPPCYGYG